MEFFSNMPGSIQHASTRRTTSVSSGDEPFVTLVKAKRKCPVGGRHLTEIWSI
jgi:hypothetical protein